MLPDNLNPGEGEGGEDEGSGSGGGKSTITADWKEALDAGIKEHPSLSDFKTPADLAKSWVNAQKLIGKEKIPLPGEKATKEDWDVVFSRLGRPEKPEGYTLPEIEVPEDFPLPAEEQAKEFLTKAHEIGMLPSQVNALYEWFLGNQVGAFNTL